MAMTMFERAGGFAKLRQVVADLYDRALASDALAHHFAAIDMRVLIDHQTKFIASLMGGPASFSDDALRRAHARLNITRDEFAEMAELLRETLDDHDFEPSDIELVLGEFRRRESCIVTSGGRSPDSAEEAVR